MQVVRALDDTVQELTHTVQTSVVKHKPHTKLTLKQKASGQTRKTNKYNTVIVNTCTAVRTYHGRLARVKSQQQTAKQAFEAYNSF